MNGRRVGLVLALVVSLLASATPAQAQLFGKRTPPTPPEKRVPELLKVIKEDGDENKRLEAVDELRGMDAKAFPEIVPVLVEVMLNDKKPSVRAEAAYTLGRYRPVQQLVGSALEYARDKDGSMRVRLQARGTLVTYYLAGYRSTTVEDTKQPGLPASSGTSPGKEPPLAPGSAAGNTGTTGPGIPVITTTTPRLTPTGPGTTGPTRTGQPNLPAAPPPVVVERSSDTNFQPLPRGPQNTPPMLQPVPTSPTTSGPDLGLPPR